MPLVLQRLWLCAALALAGCTGRIEAPAPPVFEDEGPVPDFAPGPPTMKRLTVAQYRNSVVDLLGEGLVIPESLEPDISLKGFISVGSATTAVSRRGIEQYEAAAYDLAEQALAADRRAALVPCTPGSTVDSACARQFTELLGRRAFRRPLEAEELDRLVAIADGAAEVLGDFYAGLQYVLAALLQSPHFLFQPHLGESDPGGGMRLTSFELATRLSFLLWNGPPDDALLEAAAAGELHGDAGITAQATRMLADPRARRGVRSFFSELFELHRLDELNKDPKIFVHASPELGPAAREETLRGLEALIFDEDGDYRDILVTERTFVDRRLASVYDIRAPSRDGFGEVLLPGDGARAGLLGQLSVLALHAHPVSSSATLRGRFLRATLLCGEIPPPPANVDTSLPEPSGTTRTLRERVAEHLTNPACASCHERMDPLGLGLENFDGIGRYRPTDNGAEIDASGALDGFLFDGPRELGWVVREHPNFGPCVARSLYRFAQGRVETDEERAALRDLTDAFVASGYRFKQLLIELVRSPAFRSFDPATAQASPAGEEEG